MLLHGKSRSIHLLLFIVVLAATAIVIGSGVITMGIFGWFGMLL